MIKKSDNNEQHDRPRIKPPEIRKRQPGRPEAPIGAASHQDKNPFGGPNLQQRNARPPMRRPSDRPAESRREEHHTATSRPSAPRESGALAASRRPRRDDRMPRITHVRNPKMGPGPGGFVTSKEKGNDEAVRFVPLGGLEEVGRNCMFLEYKDEIVIIDVGLQFPEDETPGIDYIIPNTQYLEAKKQNIQAIILTHGHYDHIGALPHIAAKLGNPTVYATSITKAIIEKRQEDFPNSPKLKIVTIKNGDEMKISKNFDAVFFGVPHTIPETSGVLMKTPAGNVVHFADFRVDYNDAGEPQGLEEFERIGKMGVHTFMIDSTNAEKPGHSVSEKTVERNLEEIFKKAEGRIIVATFSSLLTRIAEIIKICEKLGRKVALNGYSMKANVQIAQTLGFVTAKEDTIVPIEDVAKIKDNKILILSTGAQGESNAGLMKMITGEHRHLKIKQGDTMVLSSSVIPGNERSVQTVKDNLARQGAIVYHSSLVDIHSSGHAPKEDLALVMKLINPKYLVPVHGYYFMRAANGITAREAGIPKENVILMDNGQVAELTKDKLTVTTENVPAYYVMVDGLGVGDVEEVVVRDRRTLAAEGMIVVILTLDRSKGKLLKNPDIISRGFIYLKENQELIDEMRKRVRGIMERLPNYREIEPDYVKTLIRDQVGQFLYNQTRRRPMILPVLIEI